MKAEPGIIDGLNEILTGELTAINVYYIHYKMQENWGFDKLASHARSESMGEMKHADKLIERILYLDGVPNMARYDEIQVGDSCEEQLQNQFALEKKHVTSLQNLIHECIEKKDFGTKELLDEILMDSEESCDWLETQFSRIKDIGIQNYLAEHM